MGTLSEGENRNFDDKSFIKLSISTSMKVYLSNHWSSKAYYRGYERLEKKKQKLTKGQKSKVVSFQRKTIKTQKFSVHMISKLYSDNRWLFHRWQTCDCDMDTYHSTMVLYSTVFQNFDRITFRLPLLQATRKGYSSTLSELKNLKLTAWDRKSSHFWTLLWGHFWLWC